MASTRRWPRSQRPAWSGSDGGHVERIALLACTCFAVPPRASFDRTDHSGTAVLVAHHAIIALVALTPFLLFFDNTLVGGLVELYAAIMLAILAVSIRPGEAGHWMKTTRRAALLAALPLVWVAIQLLPIPSGGVSGSIWQTASAALDTKLLSSITIDPGITILSLCRYASLIVVGLIASAVAIERAQTERLFFAIGGATLVIALVAITFQFNAFPIINLPNAEPVRTGAIAGCIDGIVLFATIAIMVVERHGTRRNRQDYWRQFVLPLGGALVSLAICSFAILMIASSQAIFAAICGLLAVGIVQFVRRIGLGRRAALAMAGVAIAGAAAIVATKSDPAAADFSIRFASNVSADLVAVANRIIGEVGLAGSGAGTFEAIYRLYAPQDTTLILPMAPTAAAQIAIELGRPALWAIVAIAIALILLCGRGGFDRGRDFFYSTAGAGVGVATLVWGFCSSGINNIAVSILLAVTLGLTLAQSVSRTLDPAFRR